MDKVKKYWQTVTKEREVFWSSLFNKYEEEKENVDLRSYEQEKEDVVLRSYVDNSSSRINTLLQLANDDEKDATPEHPCTKVAQECEKQPCGVSDANLQLPDNDVGNQEPKQREPINVNHPVEQVKRAEPAYVVEIMPDEENEEWKSFLNSTKKFKLCDSSMKTKDNVNDFVTDDKSVNSSGSPHSEALNESFAPNVSMQREPLRFVCRRIKPSSFHTPSPKRFKLA